ncbi:MAG TPA: Ku protein [Trueperaceae bacterium]
MPEAKAKSATTKKTSGSKKSAAKGGSAGKSKEKGKKGDGKDRTPRGRPVWSGTLAFGLVTLPVELYPTTRPGGISLRMIAPDGTPLSRRYFCEADGEILTSDEIVRGYPVGEDEFVMVEDEELEALDPDRSRVIDLDVFVPRSDLDPSYVQNTYVLLPGKDAATAYRLLAASMAEEDRAGIATFVMRGTSYPLAIVSVGGTLRGMTLRYHDEVRSPQDVGLPELETADVDDVKAIEGAVEALAADSLDTSELGDARSERITKLVEKRLKSGEGVHEAPEEEEPSEDEDDAVIVDVMQLLKESLGKAARA